MSVMGVNGLKIKQGKWRRERFSLVDHHEVDLKGKRNR